MPVFTFHLLICVLSSLHEKELTVLCLIFSYVSAFPHAESCKISKTMQSINYTHILCLLSEDSPFPVDLTFTNSYVFLLNNYFQHMNAGLRYRRSASLCTLAAKKFREIYGFPLLNTQNFQTHLGLVFPTLIFPLPQFPIFIFYINFQSCLRSSMEQGVWMLCGWYVCV